MRRRRPVRANAIGLQQCRHGGELVRPATGFDTFGPFAGPLAATGGAIFDGAGRVTGIVTAHFNCTVSFPFSLDCDYTVSTYCKRSRNYFGSMFDPGKQFLPVSSDPGSVLAVAGRKI